MANLSPEQWQAIMLFVAAAAEAVTAYISLVS